MRSRSADAGAPCLTRRLRQECENAFPFSRIATSALIVLSALCYLSTQPMLSQEFPDNNTAAASKATKSMVAFLFPEQVTVPAQKNTAVDLHFQVADGLHINSHAPHEKSLIPTNLAIIEQDGFKVTAVDFPPGSDYAFAFDPKENLSVYTGNFVLKAHITAPPGEHLLQGALRYQACNSNSCYPPKTIPVAIDVIGK